MPIRQITPKADVEAYLQDQLMKREKSIVRILSFVGDACVTEAKSNPGYTDQTGNLKSSIGYAVIHDGVVVNKSGFKQVMDGADGKKEGEGFLSDLVGTNSKGIILIVVAGMNYAAYVETRGNVITSAELLAEKLVPQMLKELGFIVK